MGLKNFFKNLFSYGRVEVVEDPYDVRDNHLRNLFTSSNNDILNSIHDYSNDRSSRISDYREMLKDGITLSAVELISEDSSLIDQETKLAAWVTCASDPDFAIMMTNFLSDKVHINDIIYSLAFNIVAFGEAFLDTNYSNELYRSQYNLGDYFSLKEPEDVVHIYSFGVPLGYIHQKDGNMNRILPEKSYIHFVSDRANKEYLDEDSETYIQYGASFLEGARSYYKQRQLLDDLLVLARLTRSSYYRLFSVDVGAASSQDTARMMRELKTAVSSKQAISVSSEVFSSKSSPILTGGNVYFPTRNGQGAVTVNEVGGEINVSALSDIDYFDDRYYGALKVPKQFLGQADEAPGGLGDTTLTQLDIRYARTVKRCQRIIRSGLKDLIYWYCSVNNILPPEFDIEMPKILTAEDTRLSEIQKNEVDIANSIIDLINNVDEEAIANSDKKKLLYTLLNRVSKDQAIIDSLNFEKLKPEDATEEESSEDTESNDFDSDFRSSDFGGSDRFNDTADTESEPAVDEGPDLDITDDNPEVPSLDI